MKKTIVSVLVICFCGGLLLPVYAQGTKEQEIQKLTKKVDALSKDMQGVQAQCDTLIANQQQILAELGKIRVRVRRG